MNGESQLRDLEVWQPEDDCVGGGIEDDMNSNSWTPEEMFAKVKKPEIVTQETCVRI